MACCCSARTTVARWMPIWSRSGARIGTWRARSERLLPCAVLDTAGPVIATPRRKAMARALDIDWIDTTQVIWTPDVGSWLVEASVVAERV